MANSLSFKYLLIYSSLAEDFCNSRRPESVASYCPRNNVLKNKGILDIIYKHHRNITWVLNIGNMIRDSLTYQNFSQGMYKIENSAKWFGMGDNSPKRNK